MSCLFQVANEQQGSHCPQGHIVIPVQIVDILGRVTVVVTWSMLLLLLSSDMSGLHKKPWLMLDYVHSWACRA